MSLIPVSDYNIRVETDLNAKSLAKIRKAKLVQLFLDLKDTFRHVSEDVRFFIGTVVPPNTTGQNGDVFINTSNWDWYERINGSWTKTNSLGGADGKSVELQKTLTAIQWRQEGAAGWADLIAISDLKGEKGDPFVIDQKGTLAGKAAFDAEDEGFTYLDIESGELYFRVGAAGTWSGPFPFAGQDARAIEIQNNGTYIQTRYAGDTTWTNLVLLSSLMGEPGDPGDPGTNGREVTIRNNGTHIQWQYVGESVWNNLVALADLKGEPGDPGVGGDGTSAALIHAPISITNGLLDWAAKDANEITADIYDWPTGLAASQIIGFTNLSKGKRSINVPKEVAGSISFSSDIISSHGTDAPGTTRTITLECMEVSAGVFQVSVRFPNSTSSGGGTNEPEAPAFALNTPYQVGDLFEYQQRIFRTDGAFTSLNTTLAAAIWDAYNNNRANPLGQKAGRTGLVAASGATATLSHIGSENFFIDCAGNVNITMSEIVKFSVLQVNVKKQAANTTITWDANIFNDIPADTRTAAETINYVFYVDGLGKAKFQYVGGYIGTTDPILSPKTLLGRYAETPGEAQALTLGAGLFMTPSGKIAMGYLEGSGENITGKTTLPENSILREGTSYTGYTSIDIPLTSNNWHILIKLTIQEFIGEDEDSRRQISNSVFLIGGGVDTSGNWYDPDVSIMPSAANRDLPVRFIKVSESKWKVYIGDANTNWSHVNAIVDEVSFVRGDLDELTANWTIARELAITGTVQQTKSNNLIYAKGSGLQTSDGTILTIDMTTHQPGYVLAAHPTDPLILVFLDPSTLGGGGETNTNEVSEVTVTPTSQTEANISYRTPML